MELKQIKDFNYFNYYVDKQGNVFNSKGRKLKQYLANNGYLKVTLSKNGKAKTFNVHRLIAEAFIENHNNFSTVDHVNGVRSDNRLVNLRFCTDSDNHNFKLARNHHRESNKQNVRKSDNLEGVYKGCSKGFVYQFSGETLISAYTSISQAEKLNEGWTHQGISIAINGGYNSKDGWVRVNQYKGFRFERDSAWKVNN